jgi:MFS family permease
LAIATSRHYFGGLSRNTFLLAASSLFADISTEMLVPVLPIFLIQSLNATGSVVGLIEGIAGATQNIVQGLSGSLSDKLRRRKPVALVGYLLAAIGKPLMGLATAWPGVLAGRFVDRFGSGTRSAPRDALVAASVDDANRGKAFGLEGAGDNAGACLGPLLTVMLLVVYRLPIRILFYLAVIPGVLAFVMVLFVHERRLTTAAKSKLDTRLGSVPAAYWKLLLAMAIFGVGNSSNAFLILETKELEASLTTTILIYAGFNLVAALISYPAGWLSDHVGRRNLVLLSFAIFFLTYLGFALTRSAVLIGVLFVLYGLYQGIFRSVGKALASDLTAPARHASAIGWFNTTIGLSGLVASLLAGWLWDHVGHSAVFSLGAASAAAGIIAVITLIPASSQHVTTTAV